MIMGNIRQKLGVLRYTGFDNNRDNQSYDYRYHVNLVCDDIPQYL